LLHEFHGGHAESELGFADGGEGDAGVFGGEEVAEAGDRDVLGDADALGHEGVEGADGDEVVDGLEGGDAEALPDQFESGLEAVVDGAAALEDEAVVDLDTGVAQAAAVAFEAGLSGRRDGGAGQERDAAMSEAQQVLRDFPAGTDLIVGDAGEPARRIGERGRGRRWGC
jgi:hypothetical protein